jgi:uncharacterized protein with LGFP repeats
VAAAGAPREGVRMTAIDEKHAQFGGDGGTLGAPSGTETACADKVGKFRKYARGVIFWHPDHGAHEVHGDIHARFAAMDFEKGLLGYPRTDELIAPKSEGRYSWFTGGAISWRAGEGTRVVYGGIFGKWAEHGGFWGFLGRPLTDETGTPDGVGRFNHFEGGSIYWTQATGAHEVHGLIRDKWKSLGWEKSPLGYPITDELPTADGTGRVSRFQKGGIQWTPSGGVQVIP